MAYDVRRVELTDLPILKRIHNEQHDYEWVDPKLGRGSIVVLKDDIVIGAGFLRPILEAVMILDKTKPLRNKAVALEHLMQNAVDDAKSLGVDRIFAWAKDPTFCAELQKHYDYEIVTGTSLCKRI